LGSVTQGNEYRYQSYGVANSSGTATVLKGSAGSLGSVILTGTTASPLVIYQATTTDATKRATAATTSLTSIIAIPTGTTKDVFTFDISVPVGLMAVWGGVVSTSTITYR
jgi:hypothetical protein